MTVVLVAGALANKPHNGGEAWVRLSWLLGLRRLGIDTWFVEQIEPATCRGDAGEPVTPERSANLAWFGLVTRRFDMAGRAALLRPDGTVIAGAESDVLHDLASSADLLINISGNLTIDSLLRLPRRRAYLDLDPGYTQLWHHSGALGPALLRHDDLLTVGLAIHDTNAQLPLDGLTWRPVPPPVVLSEWPAIEDHPLLTFTTVASWRGGYGRAEHDGHLYGQKAHQFRRFANVPRQSARSFEAALEIHPDDHKDARLLQDGGWQLADPRAVAGDPDAFRRYVRGSGAEFSPAQGIYVETNCGWFGDRTTRYLASGRPAIIQDIGLPSKLPLGEGLLSFRTPEEAVAAVEAVAGDYRAHARAARQIAEEHFDSDRVVRALLEDLVS
jgi:hypothetical protein